MPHGDSRLRSNRPPAPRGVCIGVGAVLSATGGTLLSIAAAGLLGGGALVTTAHAGGPPHSVAQPAARPAHAAAAPVVVPAPAVTQAVQPPATGANPPPAHVNPPLHAEVSSHLPESAVGSSAPPPPAPPAPVAAAPAPPPAPPVTAAPPPPPHATRAARAIAIPVTGSGAAEPLGGALLLGAGATLLARTLRRPARRPRPFDDSLPAHW